LLIVRRRFRTMCIHQAAPAAATGGENHQKQRDRAPTLEDIMDWLEDAPHKDENLSMGRMSCVGAIASEMWQDPAAGESFGMAVAAWENHSTDGSQVGNLASEAWEDMTAAQTNGAFTVTYSDSVASIDRLSTIMEREDSDQWTLGSSFMKATEDARDLLAAAFASKATMERDWVETASLATPSPVYGSTTARVPSSASLASVFAEAASSTTPTPLYGSATAMVHRSASLVSAGVGSSTPFWKFFLPDLAGDLDEEDDEGEDEKEVVDASEVVEAEAKADASMTAGDSSGGWGADFTKWVADVSDHLGVGDRSPRGGF